MPFFATNGRTNTGRHPISRKALRLAHRDYSLNRSVQITIKPRISLSIRNPGQLPPELILEKPDDPIPVRRIFANPRARNPRLADILKLHSK